jgi:hypothetical protein
MTSDRRLLILSCARRKCPHPGLQIALNRYDGPMFRILRKFLRECPSRAKALDVYILSAKFGLISSRLPIPDYNCRMTSRRANRLKNPVLTKLRSVLTNKRYKELFVSVGRDYFQALADHEQIVPPDLKVKISTGTRSRRQAELHDWLYGGPPVSTRTAVARNGKARIRGVEVAFTPEQVMDVARRALTEGRDGSTRFQSWYVQVDGQRIAPKWLVNQLTGLPVSDFVSDEARRMLMQLGIKVVRV